MHRGLILFYGKSEYVFARVQQLFISLVKQNFRVHILDCAIRLNLFAIVEESQRHFLNPDVILSHITIQRLFTPYQILTVTQELTPEILPVFLAPHKQFFDGDVGFKESMFLLGKLYQIWSSLAQKQHLLVVEKESYEHPVFRSHFPQLLKIAKESYRLGPSKNTLQKIRIF
ncbi:MAG: hypothetical protein NZM25_07890 [Leptospiraceae bacterium]|nr:hypothetical protein [Leptospiraceae bacterium]MDW8305521.1 hypothetical protein [Leptospiraceae bacterium]